MKYGQFVGAVCDILDVPLDFVAKDVTTLLNPDNQGKEFSRELEPWGVLPSEDVDVHGAATVVIVAIAHTLHNEDAALAWSHRTQYTDMATVTRALHEGRALSLAIETSAIMVDACIPVDLIKAIRALYAPAAQTAVTQATGLRAVN